MIGAGIFTTSGLLMQDLLSPFLMILLWIIAGVIAFCGGEYIYLSKLFHPVFGFLSGWVSFFVGFSAPIAASALGSSEYITRAFPTLLFNYEPAIIMKLYAILIIVAFTFIHIKGIEFGAKVQNYLTVLKVLLIVILVTAGFLLGQGDFSHFSQGGELQLDLSGWKTMGLSLMWIMFAYCGWNASAYIGSEIKNPRKNLPFSLLLGTGIVMLLYILLNTLYIYAIAPENMHGVISIGGLASKNLFGNSMETLFSLLISFALFSSLSAYIILGPRVYYSMGRDGYFFNFTSELNPKSRVPSKSILLQGAIAIVMVLSGTFDQLLTYMGFSLGLFPVLTVIGVFKLRLSGKSVNKMPGYPVTPLLFLFASISILFLAYLERPVESTIAVSTVLAGIPLYFVFKSKKQNSKNG
jgi:APA family basic amino acid/polyamine antiporter